MKRVQDSPAAESRRRVVIIDDEAAICDLLSEMIGGWGYSVSTSTRLEPAEFAGLGPRDLILIDMMMPGKDGIQVLEALARQSVKAAVVLMSGQHADILVTAEKIAQRLGLKVTGLLRKPFQTRDLRRLVDQKSAEARNENPARRASDINVEDVLEGLIRQEFDAYLQPIIDLTTGQPVAFEALARWRSEKFSLVTPDRFVSVAARAGLLPRLTRQIADKALGYSRILKARGLVWRVSINLGADDFNDHSLPDKLAELVEAHQLPIRSLTVELNQPSASSNETGVLEVLARLHIKGIDLAIDDFGSSYSCLERISVIPFGSLKIDMRFISEIVPNANARTVVKSSIGLAKRLKMRSVAEGIETEAQLNLLKRFGCDLGQGFYLAQPLEFKEALDWASQFAAVEAA